MDPDGTMCYAVNLIISFILCLYTAAKIREEQDADFKLGLSPSRVSAFTLFVANILVMCRFTPITYDLYSGLLLGALFILSATVLPFCLGLAISEKLGLLLKLLSPVITVLNHSITYILLLPVHIVFSVFKLNTEEEVTQQDVMDLVEDAHEDVIDEGQKEMIENIFELDNITAGDIMTHRTEVFAINGEEKCKQIINSTMAEGFSRIPVYDGTVDTIFGILYTKDLLSVVGDEEKMELPVKNFVRKAMFVPETCAARELLVQFKLKHNQIAIVVDEYGGTSGIVTMEDVLEEIVGNIQDEYDNEEELYIKNVDGSYDCMASMELSDLLEMFEIEQIDDSEDEDFDSIGGLIIDRLARIPEPGENAQVEYMGLIFTVTEVADRRIIKVNVAKKQPETQA